MLSRLAHVPRRLYSAGRVSLAEAAAAASESAMTLNLVTPHQPIHHLKKVDKVMLPGEDGEYGVTAGHSPLISQLQPGVVTIVHLGGAIEKLFVPGGFAITHANSVTDVSVPEAVAIEDLDPEAIKSGYLSSQKSLSAASNEKDRAMAQVEVSAFTNLARAVGVAL